LVIIARSRAIITNRQVQK